MAVHPLRSATHHCLGGLLSHQLANAPQAHPMVQQSLLSSFLISGISQTFAWVSQSLGQITYVLLTRSPLNVLLHSDRLACIRHAASVHPEPGSNSQIFIYFFVFYFSWPLFSGLNFFLNFIDVVLVFFFLLSFQRSVACRTLVNDSFLIISHCFIFCQQLFL